jgi:DNA-directed RNA polymerase subunit M/transcription elongation factor TFIIS
MKTVDNFPDLASAQTAVSLLRAEGIEATIVEEHHVGLNWQIGTALRGVHVQVDDLEVVAARELLAMRVAPDHDPTEEPLSERDVCPACGQDAVIAAPWRKRVKAIALLFPPLLLMWPFLALLEPRYECRACGHRWK